MKNTPDRLKFISDGTLGKLSRWLRIAGYDVYYNFSKTPEEILSIHLKEKRIILTRNKWLLKNGIPGLILFINSTNFIEQLKQVIDHFNLDIESSLFTRCSLCNNILSRINKKDVADRIPEYVYKTQNEFYICNDCGRIYWEGTHINYMRKIFGDLK